MQRSSPARSSLRRPRCDAFRKRSSLLTALVLSTGSIVFVGASNSAQGRHSAGALHNDVLVSDSPGDINTVAGGPGVGSALVTAQTPVVVATTPSGDVDVATIGAQQPENDCCEFWYNPVSSNAVIRQINSGSGAESVIVGNGAEAYDSGDSSSATDANLSYPYGVAVASDGSMAIADSEGIRFVAGSDGTNFGESMTAGDIYTLSGNAYGVQFDGNGNLLLANGFRVQVIADASGSYYGQSMTAGDVYTIAGTGTSGNSGSGGLATSSEVGFVDDVKVDGAGNVVLADPTDNVIWVLAESTDTYYGQAMTLGHIYTIGGNGDAGYSGDGGLATSAEIKQPSGVAIDGMGNILIADWGNDVVRAIAVSSGTYYGQSMTAGHIYTVAGTGTSGYSANGTAATSADFDGVTDVGLDSNGNIVIDDYYNNRVRVVASTSSTYYGQSMTSGDVYTIAGNGTAAYSGDGESALDVEFSDPQAIATDTYGNIFVSDNGNGVVRMVAEATGEYFGQSMTDGDVYTVAGSEDPTYPYSTSGVLATESPVMEGSTIFGHTYSATPIATDAAGNVIIADSGDRVIRVVAVRSGTYYGQSMDAGYVYTIAGDGGNGYSGDGGPATSAALSVPSGVTVDWRGNVVFSDSSNNVVRVVAEHTGEFYGQSMTKGDIYTIAGNGTYGDTEDDHAATSADLVADGAAVDYYGNIVIADGYDGVVRVVASSKGTFYGESMTKGYIYTVAGDGTVGDTGDGSSAASAELDPTAVEVDGAGNLIVCDTNDSVVRVVAESDGAFYGTDMSSGHIYTVAGSGTAGFSGDGGSATSADMFEPGGDPGLNHEDGAIALDGDGHLIIADTYNGRIREVDGAPPTGAPILAIGVGSGGSGTGVARHNTTCVRADPVNCASGDFTESVTDESVSGRGPELDLSRTYNSLEASTEGIFGYGWSSSYDMSLTTNEDESVTIAAADGSQVTAEPTGDDTYAMPSWSDSTLSVSDDIWTYVDDQTETYTFNSSGELTSITDLNGYSETLSYTSGKLTTVTDVSGRTLTFSYGENGLVSEVTDPDDQHTTYGYDGYDDLTTVSDPMDRVTSYGYDDAGDHLLLTVKSPNGQSGGPDAGHDLTNTYYDDSEQIHTQTDPQGLETTFSYSGDNFSTSGGSTTITDPHDNVEVEDYESGELMSKTKGYGSASPETSTYSYDPSSLGGTSVTDPNGNTTTSTYDANGNLLTSSDALGNTTTYTYNSFDEPLTVTDPMGIETVYTYDDNGNVLTKEVIGAGGSPTRTTTYSYDDGHAGDVTSITDPDEDVTDYTYDSYGDVASTTTNPGSSTISYVQSGATNTDDGSIDSGSSADILPDDPTPGDALVRDDLHFLR